MPKRADRPIVSRRQFECLQGVADHLDSVQIAARLGISEHTVNSHLTAAVAALEASSRRDAVRKYLRLQAEHPEKLTGQFLRLPGEPIPLSQEPETVVVQEPQTPFEWCARPEPAPAPSGEHHDLGGSVRIFGIIVAVALGIVVLLLATDPLVQSASRLANLIHPF